MKECDVIKQEPWGLPAIIIAMITTLIGIATTAKPYGLTISTIVGLGIVALWGWSLYGNCKSVYTRLRLHTDRVEENYHDAKQKADKLDDLILGQITNFDVIQSSQSIQTKAQPIPEKEAIIDHTQSHIE